MTDMIGLRDYSVRRSRVCSRESNDLTAPRNKFPHCGVLATSALLIIFFLQNNALGADTREFLRQQILRGDEISLNASDPEDARSVDAGWIKDAIIRHVRVRVHNAVIRGRAELADSIIDQELDLGGCIFQDYADFSYTIFKRDFFVSDAVFRAGAAFQSTAFQHRATFQRTRFEGGPIIFADSHFFGEFSAEEARFGSKYGGTAVFSHAQFETLADFARSVFNINAHFITVQFLGQALFSGTEFSGSADFSRAHFFDVATFGAGTPANLNATFEREAIFIETQFDSLALFNGVTFNDRALFVSARFNDDVHFETCAFRNFVSFRSVVFRAVFFSRTGRGETSQFGSDIDLLGCSYDRIEINWKSLLRYPNGQSRIHPYNRQPYIELEGVLRKAGYEKDADAVYVERHHVENSKGWGKWADRLYWLLANYGIDLWHELIGTVIFLIIGTVIFSSPGAVVVHEPRHEAALSWYQALRLATHQFLPVSLPVKPKWEISERVLFKRLPWPFRKAASYANFLHLLGWVLVPLAVAALAGLLRYSGQ